MKDAGNYRSICALPVLYKLFVTALYARAAPKLDKCQPPDQGGFRPTHHTVDHFMVFKMLEQRCREWCAPLHIPMMDCTKALDRRKHQALRSSLEHCGIGLLHSLLKFFQSTRRISRDRQRECSVLDEKRHETMQPCEQLTVQHSVTTCFGGRPQDRKGWFGNPSKQDTGIQQRKQKEITVGNIKIEVLQKVRVQNTLVSKWPSWSRKQQRSSTD